MYHTPCLRFHRIRVGSLYRPYLEIKPSIQPTRGGWLYFIKILNTIQAAWEREQKMVKQEQILITHYFWQ